ncbi:MAG: glycosyl hydrolase, partial [Gemmatimonadota bacterium]|nr:glycosyl hydrolase [Gemmatimonadota bacterium]
DYGRTWTKIVNGIPSDDFIRAVREDPARPGMLYAASERTVYVSWDDGTNWQPLSLNLPVVQVSDLVVEDHDLVIGTHGRSFWVMNNMVPLRQLTPEVAAADFHLYDPVDVVRGVDRALEVYYFLKEDAEEFTMEFLDSDGNVIQTYEGTSEAPRGGGGGFGRFGFMGGGQPMMTAGSHSFNWNMRYPGWTDFEGRIFWAAAPIGPAAIPGRYQVRITADGETQTQDFEIKLDPRAEGVTLAQLQERFEFALRIRDRVTEANEAVLQIRGIKTDVDDRLGQTSNQAIQRQGQTVNTNLSAVEGEIYQVRNRSGQDPLNFPIKLNNKIAALLNVVESGESGPTAQSYEVFDHLSGMLQTELIRMNTIIEQDLQRLNELLQAEGLDPIEVERPIS